MYNGSNYLREAIDSALAQTYPNIEIIVVNDGSQDEGKTEAIAHSFGNKIRYFSKENGGVASALNYGINQMTGEWFAWLSHDDIFSENRFEEDINLIRSTPNIKITFCKVAIMDSNGNLLREVVYPINKVTNPREALSLRGVHMCSMTIHKSCFIESGFFDEKNKTMQDVQMSLLLSSRFPFYLNDKSVTYSRDHQERGTYILYRQHEEDQRYFCDFIHNKMVIEDFFPTLKNNLDNISDALVWMGDLYCNFGALKYAEECFHTSVQYEKNTFKKILTRLKLINMRNKTWRNIFISIGKIVKKMYQHTVQITNLK